MGRTKPDEVKIMTGGNLAIMGGITLTSEGQEKRARKAAKQKEQTNGT